MCNHSIKYIDDVLRKTLININQEKSCSLTLITNHFWSATSVVTFADLFASGGDGGIISVSESDRLMVGMPSLVSSTWMMSSSSCVLST